MIGNIRDFLDVSKDQKIYKKKPTHGPCCTCQDCGYDRYECARCGFSTVIDSVMSKHLAGCKVPLNGYGG